MINRRSERQKLVQSILRQTGDQSAMSDKQLKSAIFHVITTEEHGKISSLQDKQQLADQIFADMRGLDILQDLFNDHKITEIMVNGPSQIFIEKEGSISKVDLSFENDDHLRNFIARCFGSANRLISEHVPIAGMKLADGSRLQAVLSPAAVNGPYISIRRFTGIKPELSQLEAAGFLSHKTKIVLQKAVESKKNIFISGGTGSGKTTFLNALSDCIPKTERIITIEDEAELDLQGISDLVRLQARLPAPDGSGEITLSDLIRLSLRMRPDRIIVGEVRGREAYDMIQAMHTGHPGSMSTGHGNSAADMLERLSLMLIMNSSIPWEACRMLVAQAVDLVVQLKRTSSGLRLISEVVSVDGIDNDNFTMTDLLEE
ncbi:MAG: pilus assembly protein CpaF [Clostridiales bacterium]|jgi:pilus assembly protein CpaF|nr:pilus assembly protein CpaF [Clostridiales bacterium]